MSRWQRLSQDHTAVTPLVLYRLFHRAHCAESPDRVEGEVLTNERKVEEKQKKAYTYANNLRGPSSMQLP